MRPILALLVALVLAHAPPLRAESRELVLYKDPSCSCCSAYAEYLRAHGFRVRVVAEEDMAARHAAAGTPEGFEGCHLAVIEGYVVEGHVPAPVIARLLDERPDVAGISLPGMPEGSPGMGGAKTGPFTIYGFGGGLDRPAPFAVD